MQLDCVTAKDAHMGEVSLEAFSQKGQRVFFQRTRSFREQEFQYWEKSRLDASALDQELHDRLFFLIIIWTFCSALDSKSSCG